MPEVNSTSEDIYTEYTAVQAESAHVEKRLLREKNLRDKFGYDNGKKIKSLLKKLSRLNATKSELKSLVSTTA